MAKLRFLLLLVLAVPSFAQTGSKEILARIFVSIPDSFFVPLKREQPDSIVINKALRQAMVDTVVVSEEWNPVLHFTAFDSVHGYLRLLSKQGDPEGMSSEIAYWNRKDGNRLVIMTINYGDMCVEEQRERYFWIDNGKSLIPVNESDVLPAISSGDCIAAAFLKKHKSARQAQMPYGVTLEGNGNSITFSPEFDYLFSCEGFEKDPWYGLTQSDIIRKEIVLVWDGNRFQWNK